ncbi:MAG: class I SAM-dependent methyltransferase [Desulfobulbaceae bacterium]|nr:class I SAM-dependent methyltransferase [Desulfobulbaceae bacterium]
MDILHSKWNESYKRGENFLFYPNEEVIRFTSKNIRKQVGLHETYDVGLFDSTPKMLDLGCGIGRHVMHAFALGIDAYGIDLSDDAIELAIDWAKQCGIQNPEDKIKQGDVTTLPWPDSYFDYVISHGVLDSMPFQTAIKAACEAARVLKCNGLFYCDLVSGDDSNHSREFTGEESVETNHEKGTIQSYFNHSKILKLFVPASFEILECFLIKRHDIIGGGFISRYHLTLKKK